MQSDTGQRLPEMQCMGCRLNRYLDTEADHLKLKKNEIMSIWLRKADGTRNEDDLTQAIINFKKNKIRRLGKELDRLREDHIERDGYDCEIAERQKPVPPHVLRAKRGNFLSSPKIGEWQNELNFREECKRDPMAAQWGWGRLDRAVAHGRYQ